MSVTRTAVVTGATSDKGIGVAVAERYAREGWAVVILDLDGEKSAKVAAEIGNQFGVPAFGHAVDVTGYYAGPLTAFVDLSGTVQYGSRVVSVTHPSTGNYVVTFDRDVSGCSFQVTPYAYNYAVAVGPEFLAPKGAHVYIHDQDGATTPHDDSFFITAIC